MPLAEFINKRKKALIIAAVFVAFTVVVVQRFLPNYSSTDEGVLIYENVSEEPIDFVENGVFSDKAPDIALDELREIFKGEETDYWEGWTWGSKMVEIIVSSSSHADGYVAGYISRPTVFPSEYRKVVNNCPKDQTVAVGADNPLGNILYSNFDLTTRVDQGDRVYAYCLDSECLNIGKKCVLFDL